MLWAETIVLLTLCPVMNYGLFLLISSGPQVTMLGHLPASVAPAGQHANLDVRSSEGLVQSLYAKGIADSTRSTYFTAQLCYLTFCSNFRISPLPLSEYSLSLFCLPCKPGTTGPHNLCLLIWPLLFPNLLRLASAHTQPLAMAALCDQGHQEVTASQGLRQAPNHTLSSCKN